MTPAGLGSGREFSWTPRRSRWLLVAVHIPFLLTSPIYTIVGLEGRPRGGAWMVLPMAAAIGGLQLWHSFAAARDVRPSGWPWTFVALLAVVYLPMPLFTWNWAAMQSAVIASAAMHLRGRAAAVGVAGPVLGTAAVCLHWAETDGGDLTWTAAAYSFYWLVALALMPALLYGTARLVRALDDLYDARAELARVAVGGERSRLARDLHDLVGQSLTAVSLKGDLALALLTTDPTAAEAEIRGLTEIARDALHDTLTVTHGEHTVSLSAEAERAARLLEAAGIDTHVDVAVRGLPAAVDEALAWATREGVTNLLKHSQARHCWITAARHDGLTRLEVVNDGSRGTDGDSSGRGLVGVTERVQALRGSASAAPGDGDRFVLRVEVPEVAR
jgi:two-component system sensor histidine kinase DesK